MAGDSKRRRIDTVENPCYMWKTFGKKRIVCGTCVARHRLAGADPFGRSAEIAFPTVE